MVGLERGPGEKDSSLFSVVIVEDARLELANAGGKVGAHFG